MEVLTADSTTNVSLRTITKDNFSDVLDLSVGDEQKDFVASNMYSLAEAWLETSFQPFAIYHVDNLVGFTMYGYEDQPKRWWVVRLMVDKQHQGRGFGRAAMQLLLPLMQERHGMTEIFTSYVPDNVVAGRLYLNLGFQDTGEIDEDELLVLLDMTLPSGKDGGSI